MIHRLLILLCLSLFACDHAAPVPYYPPPVQEPVYQQAPAQVAPAYVEPAAPAYYPPAPRVIIAPAPAPVIIAPRPGYYLPSGPSLRETTVRRTVTTYRTEDKVGVRPAQVAPAAAKVASPLAAPAPTLGGLRGAAQQTGGTFQVDNRPRPAASAFGAAAPRPAPAPAAPPPRPAPSFGTTAARPAAPAPRPAAPSFSRPSSSSSFGTTATRGKR